MLRREGYTTWTDYYRFCPWLNVQQGWVSVPYQSLGYAVPPSLRHCWRCTTPPNLSYAICKSRCAVCYYGVSRCKRDISSIEGKHWENPPGASTSTLNIISFSLMFFIVVPRKTAYWCWRLDIAKQVFILRCRHSQWERRENIFSHSRFH